MADTNNVGDILSALLNDPAVGANQRVLDSIDKSLKELLRSGRDISASNAMSRADTSDFFRRKKSFTPSSGKAVKDLLNGVDLDRVMKDMSRTVRDKTSSMIDEFLDGMEQELMDGLGKSKLENKIADMVKGLADSMGVAPKDIKKTLGQELGKRILKIPDVGKVADFTKSAIDKRIESTAKSLFKGIRPFPNSAEDYAANRARIFDNAKGMAMSAYKTARGSDLLWRPLAMMENFTKQLGGTMPKAYEAGKASFSQAAAGQIKTAGVNKGVMGLLGLATGAGGGALSTGAIEVGGILAGAVKSLAAAGPQLILFAAALKTTVGLLKNTKDFLKGVGEASNRYWAERQKNLDSEKKRLAADVETLVKTPFEILNKAAEQWYSAWDNNLRTIAGTQGYTKADLQDLMGNYAERLRAENLTSVVSAADLTNNLSKVLESGLSGAIAEEFAYLATKLNAAVPTQDFFGYASDYASIAANAVRMGYSQEDAIKYANEQLTTFASNVLYASREIAGGFTTGLKDAEGLFKQSVQIAQAARTGNISEISGVLTSVSAIVGAVAPDLASALVDNVYKAAVGGNSTNLVALRSLAGINASNTEFLKALTSNPKQVFADLFSELAHRQAMSEDAYMEVAEGLSSIFGVSMDAFARVDFKYLADAIQQMTSDNTALYENVQLLKSGETTTTAEQLKIQQINKMILDEGLSYVLDNEAARAIQQHMWDEQIARQITESEFAVNLQGSALQFLNDIAKTVSNILGILNPFSWIGKISDLISTIQQGSAQKDDLKQVLELGKVGAGNQSSFNNLLTRGKDLNLVDPLVSMLGGQSEYGAWRQDYADSTPWRLPKIFSFSGANSFTDNGARSYGVGSRYNWGLVGKSASRALASSSGADYNVPMYSGDGSYNQTAYNEEQVRKISSDMSNYIRENQASSYEMWSKEFNAQADLLRRFGLTDEQIMQHYRDLQTEVAAEQEVARKQHEEAFWETSNDSNVRIADFAEKIHEQNDSAMLANAGFWNKMLESASGIQSTVQSFYEKWVDYFINHTVYTQSYNHASVSEIQRKEKQGSEDAVYALAEALTKNNVDLLDPTMQTNVLLAQILKVANALLQKSDSTPGGLSLPDTIAGLSMGVVHQA